MKRVIVYPILFLILALFSTSIALGQAQTRIRVIQASNTGHNIDPSLRAMHTELGSLFSFTSYRLLRDETLDLILNQPVTISAHPGRFIEVSLIGLRRDRAKLRIRVVREEKDILNTKLDSPWEDSPHWRSKTWGRCDHLCRLCPLLICVPFQNFFSQAFSKLTFPNNHNKNVIDYSSMTKMV
jgi:hypothetical protein